ncbi:hypothetical protein ACQ4PT_019834 [Festuca glaucescens]
MEEGGGGETSSKRGAFMVQEADAIPQSDLTVHFRLHDPDFAAEVYPEGTHLIVLLIERPIICNVRARPNLVESTSGSSDLQMEMYEQASTIVSDASSVFMLYLSRWSSLCTERDSRSWASLPGQEPVLFKDTIKANIACGKNEQVSEEEIIAVAEARPPIHFLPRTRVQLSGGQKERIAIARAILKDPKLLHLDEATSVLEAVLEHIVPDALDRVTVGRTTVVVAHWLSTITVVCGR